MRNLLIGTLLVAALAACGGGGSGGGGGSVLPPPPSTMPPTAPPTSPPPSAAPAVYPGQGGAGTMAFNGYKNLYPGITAFIACGYRLTDSPNCDPNHPTIPSGPGQIAGPTGNRWIMNTNYTDNGPYVSGTFQMNQSSGGDMGVTDAVENGTTAVFFSISANGVSSTPTGVLQALTSPTEVIGPPCSTSSCPTVSSLGGTVGGWQENIYCISNPITCSTQIPNGKASLYTEFQPNEVMVTNAGEAIYVTHSGMPPSFGTGTDITQLGFQLNVNSSVRVIPCPNFQSTSPCVPDEANTSLGTIWQAVQAGNQVNTSWPYLPPGDVVGFGQALSGCSEFMIFHDAPPLPPDTSGGTVLNFTEVQQEDQNGNSTTTGGTQPVVCFSSNI